MTQKKPVSEDIARDALRAAEERMKRAVAEHDAAVVERIHWMRYLMELAEKDEPNPLGFETERCLASVVCDLPASHNGSHIQSSPRAVFWPEQPKKGDL